MTDFSSPLEFAKLRHHCQQLQKDHDVLVHLTRTRSGRKKKEFKACNEETRLVLKQFLFPNPGRASIIRGVTAALDHGYFYAANKKAMDAIDQFVSDQKFRVMDMTDFWNEFSAKSEV